MLDKDTATRNIVLALKLGLFALLLFAATLMIGVLVRYA